MNQTMLREARPEVPSPRLGDQVEAVKRDLNGLGRAAGTSAKLKLAEARDRGEHLARRLRTGSVRAVKRRPLTALGTAIAVGTLAGLWLGRK